MKHLRMLGLIAGLALAACAPQSAGGDFTSYTAEATTAAAAEQLYTTAAGLETAWLKSGVATKAQAEVVKSLDAAVYADVVAARTAAANNDSPAIAAGLQLFNQALPQLTGYVASHGGANVQPK